MSTPLKGSIDYRLVFRGTDTTKGIECETDASWDRTKVAKSFTGLLVYVNSDLVPWKSKIQRGVALSSTESELEAMTEAVKEVVWFDGLLKDIGMGDKRTRKIRCDSLNAVKLANGGNYKTQSKLLNRKSYFIRETMKQEGGPADITCIE